MFDIIHLWSHMVLGFYPLGNFWPQNIRVFDFKWKYLHKKWGMGSKKNEVMIKMLLFVEYPFCESVETRDSSDPTGLLKSQSIGRPPNDPQECNLSAKGSQFGLMKAPPSWALLKGCERFREIIQQRATRRSPPVGLSLYHSSWTISSDITRFPAVTELQAHEKHYCYCSWAQCPAPIRGSLYTGDFMCIILYKPYLSL